MTVAASSAFRGMHWVLQLLPAGICSCIGPLEVAGHLCLPGAQPAHRGWGTARMAADPIHGHQPWALMLVAVSVGCFLADGADMLRNQTLGQAWDLLCHHLVIVSCLSTTILSGHYAGFSLVSLLLELNSACLSLRSRYCFLARPQSLAFSVASWATLATLALFCLVPLGWVGLWLIQQHHQVPPALVVLGGTGLATVGTVKITLGIRILVSNVLWPWPHSPIPGHQDT